MGRSERSCGPVTWAFVVIGLVIGADAVLGYHLAFLRAKSRGRPDARAAFEASAFRSAVRHWGLTTALAGMLGSVIGAEEGPGALHGFVMVAGASIGIALPVTYVAGLFYSRHARRITATHDASSR